MSPKESALTASERLEFLRQTPVVDHMGTELLHTPIYDCGTDQFELPCIHPTFEYGETHGIGHVTATELNWRLGGDSAGYGEVRALIKCPDSLVYLSTNTILHPGADVARYVRIGPEKWFVYWWRAGMRASAHQMDPPFSVSDMAANPEKWLARELYCRAQWALSRDYRHELARCTHRR